MSFHSFCTIFCFLSPNHAYFFFTSKSFIASTISFPYPGVPIILSIVILKLDESKEGKYNDTPQRYYLQQPSVLSHIVQFLFSLLPFYNSGNIEIIRARVVNASCRLSSEMLEWNLDCDLLFSSMSSILQPSIDNDLSFPNWPDWISSLA